MRPTGKWLFAFFAVASLSACNGIPTGHGYVELDENTDPRFHKQSEPGQSIGHVQVRGRVILNGELISATRSIQNGDHIQTGASGWAKVSFSGRLGAG